MMLRPLWTWQSWMAAATPKVLRIALLSAFAPSTINNRGTVGSSPPADEIVEQGLDDDRVLRRPLDHGQDMLVAGDVGLALVIVAAIVFVSVCGGIHLKSLSDFPGPPQGRRLK